MKQSKLLIFAGAIILTLAFVFAACGPQSPIVPASPAQAEDPPATTVPIESPAADEPIAIEIIGPAETVSRR